MCRSRIKASLALLAYVAGAVALPVLHRLHHERYGADHVHSGDGTYYTPGPLDAPDSDERRHHAEFDADLAALELSDVAHAGIEPVDCALAEYTLTSCDALAAAHPHTFGDELLARHRRPSRPTPAAPDHGAGSIEHVRAALLAVAVFVLPPPHAVSIHCEHVAPANPRSAPLRLTRSSRGPPPLV